DHRRTTTSCHRARSNPFTPPPPLHDALPISKSWVAPPTGHRPPLAAIRRSWPESSSAPPKTRRSATPTSASGWTRRRQGSAPPRSEEHTSELQSRENLVCRLLLEKKKT